MYGVDEGDEAQWQLSAEWAEEGWAEEEHAGAVYDEMIKVFCRCVHCPEPPMSESDGSFMCLLSDENRDEQICVITFDEDVDECNDELIANTSIGAYVMSTAGSAATRGEAALGMPQVLDARE